MLSLIRVIFRAEGFSFVIFQEHKAMRKNQPTGTNALRAGAINCPKRFACRVYGYDTSSELGGREEEKKQMKGRMLRYVLVKD